MAEAAQFRTRLDMAGLASLTLAYVLSQFYRSFLAVLTPALTTELGVTKADLSFASGIWFATFACMQFVVGVLLDRIGPRRCCAILLGIGGAGGASLFAVAQGPAAISAAMALIGIGCSPVLMAAVFIFARTYAPARMAVLISWLIGIGSAGNVVGATPLALAAEALGWRGIMAGLAVATLVIAIAIYLVVRDPPQGNRPVGTGFGGYLDLMRIRALWLILPLVALNYAPAAGIRGLWAGPYLAETYGLDSIAVGHATLAMAVAMVVGSFAYGPLDTVFRTRKWVAFSGNTLNVAALVLLALVPAAGFWPSTLILVAIGATGMSYGLMLAHAGAFIPPHLTGRGVTLLNFFAIGGVGAGQFMSGALVSGMGPEAGLTIYPAVFLFYAMLLAIALALYLFARDAPPGQNVGQLGRTRT